MVTSCISQLLVNVGVRVQMRKGRVLFEPGEAAADVNVIRSGTVKLYDIAADGSATLYRIAGPGEWVGWTALVPGQTRITRAVAADECDLICISGQDLMAQAVQHPQILSELMKELVLRARRTHEEVVEMHAQSAEARIVHLLLWLSDSPMARQAGGLSTLEITHEDLADLLGIARETVTLVLGTLKRAHLLQTERGRIVVDGRALAPLAVQLKSDAGKRRLSTVVEEMARAA